MQDSKDILTNKIKTLSVLRLKINKVMFIIETAITK